MIWLLVLVLAVGVLAFLVEPYFRKSKTFDGVDEQDYLVAQLDDVVRDRDAGLLGEAEAVEAEAEARRRLLAAGDISAPVKDDRNVFAIRQFATMIIGAAPLAAIAIYVTIGNPTLSSTPEALDIARRAQIAGQSAAPVPSLAASINALEQRLAQAPEDVNGWAMLGESYARLDRFAEAAMAFAKARELAPERAYLHAAEGEALVMANSGIVNDDATAALRIALEHDPAEQRARFYLALGDYQRGDAEAALEALVELANEASPGVAWAPIVRSQIEIIAAELERPLAELGLTAPGSAPLIDALELEVAGVNARYESWIALAEAYAAQGQRENAIVTLDRAAERYADAPFVMQQIEATRIRLNTKTDDEETTPIGPTAKQMRMASEMSADDRAAMIAGMVDGLAARLEREPEDLVGWTMLARSYAVLGDMQNSADAYQRAAQLAPDDINLRLGRAEALLVLLRETGAPIDSEAQAAIDDISRLDSEHPFALYFQGLAASQRGDKVQARGYWERLLASMPEESPDADGIKELIDAL